MLAARLNRADESAALLPGSGQQSRPGFVAKERHEDWQQYCCSVEETMARSFMLVSDYNHILLA